MLRNFPRELHGGKFFRSRSALRDNLEVRGFEFAQIRLLNEHAAKNAFQLEFAFGIEAVRRKFQEAEIFFSGKNLFGAVVERGCGDAFDKKFGDFFRGGGIDGPVECQHATER